MSEAFLAEPLPTGEPLPLVLNPRQPRKSARRHLAKAVSNELPWLKQELAKHGALRTESARPAVRPSPRPARRSGTTRRTSGTSRTSKSSA